MVNPCLERSLTLCRGERVSDTNEHSAPYTCHLRHRRLCPCCDVADSASRIHRRLFDTNASVLKPCQDNLPAWHVTRDCGTFPDACSDNRKLPKLGIVANTEGHPDTSEKYRLGFAEFAVPDATGAPGLPTSCQTHLNSQNCQNVNHSPDFLTDQSPSPRAPSVRNSTRSSRRSYEHTRFTKLLLPVRSSWFQSFLLLLLVLNPFYLSSIAASASPLSSLASANQEKRMIVPCLETTVTVQYTSDDYLQYRNCTLIEGSLQVRFSPKYPANWSFPYLREITGHLIVFGSAPHITSLRTIFPRLAVIRGEHVIHDYALLVYGAHSLLELGLEDLTTIRGGSVRLQFDSALCYVNTVDWDLIFGRKFGLSQKLRIERWGVKKESDCFNLCLPRCRRDGERTESARCWGTKGCQRRCPRECGERGCYINPYTKIEKCCHKECLGGCDGYGPDQCWACKDYLNVDRCVSSCPAGKYLLEKHRCVTEQECRSIGVSNCTQRQNTLYRLHKPDRGPWTCVKECPENFMFDEQDLHRCIRCKTQCPKICGSIEVRSSMSSLQYHRKQKCTVIDGNVFITFEYSNSSAEHKKLLDEIFLKIVEVKGYIRINRAKGLTSLSFLKNLRRLATGSKPRNGHLYLQKYAMSVTNNENLGSLWEPSPTTTTPSEGEGVGGGGSGVESAGELVVGSEAKVHFHFNPELCVSSIERFLTNIRDLDRSRVDISNETNGDHAMCEFIPLNVSILQEQPAFNLRGSCTACVMLECSNCYAKGFVGYTVSFRKSPEQNASIFETHDPCQTTQWTKIDYPDEAKFPILIRDLEPFTQYAIFLQAFTQRRQNGGIGNITYFTTRPSHPSKVQQLEVVAASPESLQITWKPPENPNGNVTHYVIYYKTSEANAHLDTVIQERNFCTESLNPQGPKFGVSQAEKKKSRQNFTDNVCVRECLEKGDDRIQQAQTKKLEHWVQNYLLSLILNTGLRKKRNCSPQNESPTNQSFSKRLLKGVPINEFILDNQKNQNGLGGPGGFFGSKTNRPGGSAAPTLDWFLNYTRPMPPYFYLDTLANGSAPQRELESPFIERKTSELKLQLDNLTHFTEYTIQVVACQGGINNTRARCGKRGTEGATDVATTQGLGEKDRVSGLEVLEQEKDCDRKEQWCVKIQWQPPVAPNGLVLKYMLRYWHKETSSDADAYTRCVPVRDQTLPARYTLDNLKLAGPYQYKVQAVSLAGEGVWSEPAEFRIPERDGWPVHFVVIAIIGVFVVILIAVGAFVALWFMTKRKYLKNALYTSVNPEYVEITNFYTPDEWEVERENIEIIREIGSGSFGTVYEGVAKNLHTTDADVISVAVKAVSENAGIRERMEFLNEASRMKDFNTAHVVKLYGIVSKGQPIWVIMEYMPEGDLKNFLRRHRPDAEDYVGEPPTVKIILKMIAEMADGMAYLDDKKHVHRDLAARNVMVNSDLTLKIADFGMCRDVYQNDYYRKTGRGLLPVRWMAPESLKDGVFSSQSDVFSFGVVLWEMATLAEQPYQGLSNEAVLKFVIDGHRMDMPDGCHEKLYILMTLCWQHRPADRPRFYKIVKLLESDCSKQFMEVAYCYSEEFLKRYPRSGSGESRTRNTEDLTSDMNGVIGDGVGHRGHKGRRGERGSRGSLAGSGEDDEGRSGSRCSSRTGSFSGSGSSYSASDNDDHDDDEINNEQDNQNDEDDSEEEPYRLSDTECATEPLTKTVVRIAPRGPACLIAKQPLLQKAMTASGNTATSSETNSQPLRPLGHSLLPRFYTNSHENDLEHSV